MQDVLSSWLFRLILFSFYKAWVLFWTLLSCKKCVFVFIQNYRWFYNCDHQLQITPLYFIETAWTSNLPPTFIHERARALQTRGGAAHCAHARNDRSAAHLVKKGQKMCLVWLNITVVSLKKSGFCSCRSCRVYCQQEVSICKVFTCFLFIKYTIMFFKSSSIYKLNHN